MTTIGWLSHQSWPRNWIVLNQSLYLTTSPTDHDGIEDGFREQEEKRESRQGMIYFQQLTGTVHKHSVLIISFKLFNAIHELPALVERACNSMDEKIGKLAKDLHKDLPNGPFLIVGMC